MKQIILIAIAALVLNLIPSGAICTDGVNFGYCIEYKGFPFHSIFSTEGEFDIFPTSYAENIRSERIIGTIANTIIAGAIVLIISRAREKKKH